MGIYPNIMVYAGLPLLERNRAPFFLSGSLMCEDPRQKFTAFQFYQKRQHRKQVTRECRDIKKVFIFQDIIPPF